jgi:hypothetical protein
MSEATLGPRPLVIIGAGRSGTNMLRDVLCRMPGFGTWPCDEINYIWRHGNRAHPDDEFPAEFARPKVQDFLRRAFAACARREGVDTVVEKTCANTLRVGFVAAALPESARFLHLVRDGQDVVASAGKRWTAPLDIPYLLRKARFVPPLDLPYYAFRYLGARMHRLVDREGKVSFWGPRYRGMDEDLRTRSLVEVCGLQWRRSVERALEDLEKLGPGRVLHLRYERFVASPGAELARIGRFLGEDWGEEAVAAAVAPVSRGSVGKGGRELDAEQQAVVQEVVLPLMSRLEADPRFDA